MTLPLKRPQRGRERDIAFSLMTLIFYFVGGFSIILEILVTLSEVGVCLCVCVLPEKYQRVCMCTSEVHVLNYKSYTCLLL